MAKEIAHSAPHQTLQRRKIIFEVFLVLLTLSIGILTVLAKLYSYFPIDLIVTKTIQNYQASWFDSLMRFLTFLGNANMEIAQTTFGPLIFLILKQYKISLYLAISTVGAVIISETVKTIVSRVRPDPLLIHQVSHYIRNDSFPSGHVLFYLGFYGFLFYLVFTHLHKFLRAFLLSVLGLLIILIGPSRIYLGAHWFSDVLGAYLIGLLWLIIMVRLFHWKS